MDTGVHPCLFNSPSIHRCRQWSGAENRALEQRPVGRGNIPVILSRFDLRVAIFRGKLGLLFNKKIPTIEVVVLESQHEDFRYETRQYLHCGQSN